jgi:hypothetical protein
MNKIYFLFSIFFLLACVSARSRPMTGPDGSRHQLITCAAVESCYNEASKICNGSYKIVNTSTEVDGSNGNTSSWVHLLVKCGG